MRTSLKRIASVGALTLGLGAGVQAVGPAAANAAYSWKCIAYYNDVNRAQMQGNLCVRRVNNGYNAHYENRGGYAEFVSFNLATPWGVYGDNGAFWTGTGVTKTYFFAVGDLGCNVQVRLYDRAGTDPSWSSPKAC